MLAFPDGAREEAARGEHGCDVFLLWVVVVRMWTRELKMGAGMCLCKRRGHQCRAA